MRDFILDPSLVLYLPLYKLDGASFMSKDAYGHLATVTGALWTPQGTGFDGTDDRITAPSWFGDINFKNQAFTINYFIKPTLLTDFRAILAIKPATAGNFGVQTWHSGAVLGLSFIRADGASTGRAGVSVDNILAVDNFYSISWAYDGSGTPSASNVTCLVNGVAQPLTYSATTGYAFWAGWTNVIWLGYLSGDYPLKGLFGEAIVYNRQQTLMERQNLYQATKWRYR